MDIQSVLREMREMSEINSNFRITNDWADAIEAAMTQPVFVFEGNASGVVLGVLQTTEINVGTKLFAFPPSAQDELVRITEQLSDQDAEIEQLRDALELLLLSSDDIYPGDVAIARAALAGKEDV